LNQRTSGSESMSDESDEDLPCVTVVCCLEGCRVSATLPNLAATRHYRTHMNNKATTNKKNSVTVNFRPGGTLGLQRLVVQVGVRTYGRKSPDAETA
jgi:hypothetical protein